MQPLLIFFVILIALEVLALVGLVLAYRWLIQSQDTVESATSMVPNLRTKLSQEIRYGQAAVSFLPHVFQFIGRHLPWWLRTTLQTIGWIAKIKR